VCAAAQVSFVSDAAGGAVDWAALMRDDVLFPRGFFADLAAEARLWDRCPQRAQCTPGADLRRSTRGQTRRLRASLRASSPLGLLQS
jgi:hypothetical protein